MKKIEYIGLLVLLLIVVAAVAAGKFTNGPGLPFAAISSQDATVSSATSSTASTSYPTGSPLLKTLPLGDGKYVTNGPKKGYIYLCNVLSGQGAQANGNWIHGNTWTPAEKVAVQGAVKWPNASYSVQEVGSSRIIKTNDLPVGLITGIFPINSTDPAYAYDRNPNSIKAQNFSFTLPANPTPAAKPGCIYGEVGVMNDGVELFDGFDAENRDAVAHEVQDSCDGHPEKSGTYHYHGLSSCIQNATVSNVIGYAFDGYPITGGKLPNGNYLMTNDLDECHGMTSTITVNGKNVTTYHYVMTQDFPYSVSCFHGTSVFKPTPSSQGTAASAPTRGGNPPTPPAEAISACSGKTVGESCSVGGQAVGVCANIGSSFACLPAQ